MNYAALSVSVLACIVLAAAGNAWVGDGLRTWYPQLTKPRWQIPLWGFMLIGVAVYIVDGIVLYRLMTCVPRWSDRVVAISALAAVMTYNEAWNYAFFGLRSLRIALGAMVGFMAPLGVLMVALFAYDAVSGWLLLPYCVWVVYDVWWIRELVRLNPAD